MRSIVAREVVRVLDKVAAPVLNIVLTAFSLKFEEDCHVHYCVFARLLAFTELIDKAASYKVS